MAWSSHCLLRSHAGDHFASFIVVSVEKKFCIDDDLCVLEEDVSKTLKRRSRSYCISRCRTGRFSVGWCRPLGARKETLWRYSDALNYHEGECLWSQWWPILFIKHFDAFQEGCSRALATATLYRNMLNIMGLVAPWIIILLYKSIFLVQLKIFLAFFFVVFLNFSFENNVLRRHCFFAAK